MIASPIIILKRDAFNASLHRLIHLVDAFSSSSFDALVLERLLFEGCFLGGGNETYFAMVGTLKLHPLEFVEDAVQRVGGASHLGVIAFGRAVNGLKLNVEVLVQGGVFVGESKKHHGVLVVVALVASAVIQKIHQIACRGVVRVIFLVFVCFLKDLAIEIDVPMLKAIYSEYLVDDAVEVELVLADKDGTTNVATRRIDDKRGASEVTVGVGVHRDDDNAVLGFSRHG